MGSPISNAVAELNLRNLEEIVINDYKAEIRLWLRGVVDILIITTKHIKLNYVLNKLNSYDQDIQFSMEEETDYFIEYLDVKVTQTDNKINTTV